MRSVRIGVRYISVRHVHSHRPIYLYITLSKNLYTPRSPFPSSPTPYQHWLDGSELSIFFVMTGPDSVPVDTVLANGVKDSNSVNGHRPHTPSMSGLSLTEYSANPTPPSPQSEDHQARIRSIIPEEFILPNGHPDVRIFLSHPTKSILTYNGLFFLDSMGYLLITCL